MRLQSTPARRPCCLRSWCSCVPPVELIDSWEDRCVAAANHRRDYLSGYGSWSLGPDHVGGRLGAAAEVELGEDACHVVLRGATADHEPLGDLRVGATLGQECEHVVLPVR